MTPLESLLTFQGDVVSETILSDRNGASLEPLQKVLAFEQNRRRPQKQPEDLSLGLIVSVFLLKWESSGRRLDPVENMQRQTLSKTDKLTHTHPT